MTHTQPDPQKEARNQQERERELRLNYIKIMVKKGYALAYQLSGEEAHNPINLDDSVFLWSPWKYQENLPNVLMDALFGKLRSGGNFDFNEVIRFIDDYPQLASVVKENFLRMLVYELAIRDKHERINQLHAYHSFRQSDITSLFLYKLPINKETRRYPTLFRAYLDNLSSKNIALGQLIRHTLGTSKADDPPLPAELLNIIDSLDEDKAKTYCLLITLFICDKITGKRDQLGLEAYNQFTQAIQRGGLASKQYIRDAVAKINDAFIQNARAEAFIPYLEARAKLPAPLGAKKYDARESDLVCNRFDYTMKRQNQYGADLKPKLIALIALKDYLDTERFNKTLIDLKKVFIDTNLTQLFDIIKPHIQFNSNDFVHARIYSPSWILACHELPELMQAHIASMNSVVDFIASSVKEAEMIAEKKGTNYQSMKTLSSQIDSIAADSATPIGEKLKIMLMQISDTHNNIRNAKAGSPGPTLEIGSLKMRFGGAGSTTADKLSTIVTGALTHMSLDPDEYCAKDKKTHLLALNNIDKIIDILNSLPQPSQPPQPSSPRGSKR